MYVISTRGAFRLSLLLIHKMPLCDTPSQSFSSSSSNAINTDAPMSSEKAVPSAHKFSYTHTDFQWPETKRWGNGKTQHKLSKFDEELHQTWDAAVDAGFFSYKMDHMESRVVPGKYKLLVQLNSSRFTKRRKPEPMMCVSQPFNPEKFNFTKVPNREVLFELCPRHRCCTGTSEEEHNVLIINVSPLDYGHSLLIPSVNSCQPQVLTEKSLLLGLETVLLSNHRGFHVGFNSLCAYASVNHLHFHTWYSEYPSYLETADVSHVCDDLFEVRDYPTTAFVFELRPDSDAGFLAKKIHKVTTYFVNNEVAHNFHIIRGKRCSPNNEVIGTIQNENNDCVLRIFLWPRVSVTGAKVKSSYDSGERPMASFEFAGALAVETRETFDSFTEDQFLDFMKLATLPTEEYEKHKAAIQDLLTTS